MSNKIDNDEAANAAADEIVSLSNTNTKLQADMEKELAQVRAKYAPTLKMQEDRINTLKKGLLGYCTRKTVQARLFATRRSVESTTARYGFRDGAPALKPLDTSAKMEDVAAELLRKGFKKYVVVPVPKPSLDKDAIMAAGLDAAGLATLGLRKTTSTTFYIEPLERGITPPAKTKGTKKTK